MSSPKASPKNSKALFKLLRYLLLFVVACTLLVATLGIGAYYYFSRDLPKLDRIEDYKPPLVSEVFDTENRKIGEFWSECRFLTPIQDIPKKMIEAFVASEDERFFQHKGVDPMGIFRAFINNLRAGHTVQGGSTITQQVTKNLVLSPERSYDRKIKEAILATHIESKLSKDQILYLYLNHIFFGNRAYGVAAAARNYFHKDLKDLNVAEIAMIVGLSKAPSTFNPLVNPERATTRQHYVIDRMKEQGYLTAQEADTAKKTPLAIYRSGTDKDFNLHYAPYFTEHVRRYISEKYGDEALYKGGFKIYTTTSLDMMKAAAQAVDKGLREVDHQSGFRGPEQTLTDPAAIQKFNADNHIKILEWAGDIDYGKYRTNQALQEIRTPIQEGEYYDALILGGSKAKGFEVQVGNQKGEIVADSMTWAGAASQLKAGDVVQVKLYKKPVVKADKKTEKDSKTAAAGAGAPPGAAPAAPKPAAPAKTNPSTTALSTLPGAPETGPLLFALEQQPQLQGALYSYEPFTGEIKAIIGGIDYRRSEFNRATQALRQPGSAIKPLIYSAALDKGYTPNTVIMDAPLVYEESPGKFWSPKNYGGGYAGPTPLRSALVHSRNVVTVRILMDIGTHYADAYMRKLGLNTQINKYYSMALGANDVYLSELARSYGTFVTGGILPDLYFIRKMVDPSGKVIEEHKPMDKKFIITWGGTKKASESAPAEEQPGVTDSHGESAPGQAVIPETQAAAESNPAESQPSAAVETRPSEKGKGKKIPWDEMTYSQPLVSAGEQTIQKDQLSLSEYEKKVLYGGYIPEDHVITPKTAATMVSLLQDVVKYGTGTRALALGKPAAGKTGTTNGATDAWFIGFTPTLVAGVWVGHDEKIKSIGRGATGGHISAPIWLYYMKEATQRYATKDFKLPPWIDLSQYQNPMEVVKGDSESMDFVGAIPGAGGGGPGGQGGGAEFFTKDL